MPITQSAKKALRQSLRRKKQNIEKKEAFRKVLKEIKKLKEKKEIEKAVSLLPQAYKTLDKAVKTGVLKKNTASRKKSRLTRSLAVLLKKPE